MQVIDESGGAYEPVMLRDGNQITRRTADGVHTAAMGADPHPLVVPPPPPPPPPASDGLVGRVRIVGGDSHFEDDTGERLLLGTTHGHGLHLYRDQRDQCLRELDAFVGRYQSVRCWMTHGWYQRAWAGHETTPVDFIARNGSQVLAWPDYEDVVVGYAQALQDRGLRLFWSCGDLQIFQRPRSEWADPDDFDHPVPDEAACSQWARRNGELLRPFRNLIVKADTNEAWQNWLGDDEPAPEDIDRVVIDPLAEGYGQSFIKLRSANFEGEEMPALDEWARDLTQKHGYGDNDDVVGTIRHARGIFYTGDGPIPQIRLGVESEPRVIDGAEAACLLAASNLISGFAYVFHTNAGVSPWLLDVRQSSGFDEVPGVLKVLPRDVQSRYRTIVHGGEGQTLSPFTDHDNFPSDIERRVDSSLADNGDFVTIVHSDNGFTRLRAKWPVRFTIYTPGTWDHHDFVMAEDEVLPLFYSVGRILVGRRD